jgi:hypothetical protein
VHHADGAGGRATYRTTLDGASLSSADDLRAHELALTRELNQRRRDAEPELLHLHSAAVARAEQAAVFVGHSGSGKSTLVAGLLRHGFDYVTDEQVAIRPADARALAYPRPITLRRSVWPLFAGVSGVPRPDAADGDGARVEVAPLDLGTVHPGGPLEIGAIIAPQYSATADAELTHPITAAETVELLATNCWDLERLGLTGFDVLVRLAARHPARRLQFGSLPAAVAILDRELASPPAAALSVRHIPPTVIDHVPAPDSVRRSPHAHAWAFADGSTIVYRPEHLRVTRLDAAGTLVWELLEEDHDVDRLVDDVAHGDAAATTSLRAWLERLVATGFVDRCG